VGVSQSSLPQCSNPSANENVHIQHCQIWHPHLPHLAYHLHIRPSKHPMHVWKFVLDAWGLQKMKPMKDIPNISLQWCSFISFQDCLKCVWSLKFIQGVLMLVTPWNLSRKVKWWVLDCQSGIHEMQNYCWNTNFLLLLYTRNQLKLMGLRTCHAQAMAHSPKVCYCQIWQCQNLLF